MYTLIDSLVQKIHATPTMASIATTGGGTAIFPMLLEQGNGSKTLIGGFIPYDPSEHQEFLGGKSDRWVAEADARALAMSAFLKAQNKKPGLNVVGIGATSSLMRVEQDLNGKTLPERAGRLHSIYLALQMADRTITHTVVYPNTNLPSHFAVLGEKASPLAIRGEEERMTARMMLNLLAEGCGLKDRCETGIEDLIVRKEAIASEIHPDLRDVVFGRRLFVGVTCGDDLILPMPNYNPPNGLIPGSFNPLHIGHRKMRAEVLDYLKVQTPEPIVGYEITVQNADKPPIDYLSLKDRLSIIANSDEHVPVYLTNAPQFVDKAQLFKGCTFGIGYDTAVRIIDPIYYGYETQRDTVIQTIQQYGVRFLVFGRRDSQTGEFLTLNEIDHPNFNQMAVMVHETRFREDVESRNLRNQKKGAI